MSKGGSHSTYNPQSLLSAVCCHAPVFKGKQQHDAHELMRMLLDGLQVGLLCWGVSGGLTGEVLYLQCPFRFCAFGLRSLTQTWTQCQDGSALFIGALGDSQLQQLHFSDQ
jgi:hypothetical protein